MVMCLQRNTICRHQSLQFKYCIFSFSKSFLAYQFLLHVLHQILQFSLLASATLSAWCLCALQRRHSWLASARQWLNLSFGTHSQPHLECGCHVALHLHRMLACYHAWGWSSTSCLGTQTQPLRAVYLSLHVQSVSWTGDVPNWLLKNCSITGSAVTLKVPCDKAHAHILAILVRLGGIVFQGHWQMAERVPQAFIDLAQAGCYWHSACTKTRVHRLTRAQ